MIRSKSPVKAAAISGGTGLIAVAALSLTAPITGIYIGINWLTVSVGAALGLPGVILTLIGNLL